MFVCNHCLTRRENKQASDLKDRISELASTVSTLAKEFNAFKTEKGNRSIKDCHPEESTVWSNQKRTNSMKASLCIKRKGTPVDVMKIKEIACTNSIQVSKADIKSNGDVYVDIPSNHNREKLLPLLMNNTFAQNEIVKLKSKLPSV